MSRVWISFLAVLLTLPGIAVSIEAVPARNLAGVLHGQFDTKYGQHGYVQMERRLVSTQQVGTADSFALHISAEPARQRIAIEPNLRAANFRAGEQPAVGSEKSSRNTKKIPKEGRLC